MVRRVLLRQPTHRDRGGDDEEGARSRPSRSGQAVTFAPANRLRDRSEAVRRRARARPGAGPGGWPGWARGGRERRRSSSTWPPCWPVRWECRRRRELEQSIAEVFTPYFDLVDLGYSYRYYAEPPPTPVVTATLEFGDGRPEETVRLPGRDVPGPSDASPAAVGPGQCAFPAMCRRPSSGPVTRARAGWPAPMPVISVGPGPAAGA